MTTMQKSSVIVIIWLMLSLLVWPRMITISGFYSTCEILLIKQAELNQATYFSRYSRVHSLYLILTVPNESVTKLVKTKVRFLLSNGKAYQNLMITGLVRKKEVKQCYRILEPDY